MKSHQETLDLLGSLDPYAIFESWLGKARTHPHIKEPNAMTLATAVKGQPHSRVVLLKETTPHGFIFYTNYQSHKGEELAENSLVSLSFYWDALFLQVRIEGRAEKTDRLQSESYWASRARGSQISQWISAQSQPLPSRDDLERNYAAAESRFTNQTIPCPEHWGGYLVRPKLFEFWIGRENRLHDRFQFVPSDTGWTSTRLSP